MRKGSSGWSATTSGRAARPSATTTRSNGCMDGRWRTAYEHPGPAIATRGVLRAHRSAAHGAAVDAVEGAGAEGAHAGGRAVRVALCRGAAVRARIRPAHL